MPDFPDPLKDLISKMLKVEPSERITIEEIKHHPAFSSTFPNNYIVPSPLPLPNPANPIEMNSIDPGIIEILHQIGFKDDEELRESLESDQITVQKAFFQIILQNLSINVFTWPIEKSGSIGFIDSKNNSDCQKKISDDDNFDVSFNTNNITLDGLKQEKILDDSSESLYSFPEPAPWAIDVKKDDKNVEILSSTLNGFNLPLEKLFTEIQMTLSHNEFEFFYPNEFLIICRKISVGIYANIKGFYCDDGYLGLEIELVNGNQEKLNSFTDLLSRSLSNL